MYLTSLRYPNRESDWTLIATCIVTALLLSIPANSQSSPRWKAATGFGGVGTDSGNAVKVDRSGNRYLTGAFSSTATFRDLSKSASAATLVSFGGTDVFLARYSPSGKLKWIVQAGGAGDDAGFDIAFDANQNVYLSGVFTDAATFGSTNGTTVSLTGSFQTLFLAKYDPSGKLL